MRSFKLFLGIILLSIFIFSACNENISDPQPVSDDQKSLAKQPSDFINMASALNGNNGQGSIFLEPTINGFGIFIENDIVYFNNFPVSGQIAFFDAAFGNNDFWRENPDGSLSVKLNSNQASAFVYDFGTGESYAGTGHLNTKFTGAAEEICGQTCYTQLFPDPNINAHVGNGHANVVDSQGGSHQMQIIYVQNPGGGGHMKFTLN